jgi:hypothetical protein
MSPVWDALEAFSGSPSSRPKAMPRSEDFAKPLTLPSVGIAVIVCEEGDRRPPADAPAADDRPKADRHTNEPKTVSSTPVPFLRDIYLSVRYRLLRLLWMDRVYARATIHLTPLQHALIECTLGHSKSLRPYSALLAHEKAGLAPPA